MSTSACVPACLAHHHHNQRRQFIGILISTHLILLIHLLLHYRLILAHHEGSEADLDQTR